MMSEPIDTEMISIIKEFLLEPHSSFFHTIAAYIQQVERERDGLLIRCEHLCKQLNEKEREDSHVGLETESR